MTDCLEPGHANSGPILSARPVEGLETGQVQPSARILFVALADDLGSERVILELSRVGVEVGVLSPREFGCANVGAVQRHFPLPTLRSLLVRALFVRGRLEKAVREWRPLLVLPLDDMAAWLLRSIATDVLVDRDLKALLIDSLGAPAGYQASVCRADLMDVAKQLGVRTPSYDRIRNVEDACQTAEKFGYPVVVKSEHTSGGVGVSIINGRKALIWRLKFGAPRAWRWRPKAILSRILLAMAGFRDAPYFGLVMQSFVPGVPAFRLISASNGKIVAGVSFVAEQVDPAPTGASTVVRRIENAEMESAAARIVEALGCTGFVSFDYILDEKLGLAHVIEMNARSTPCSHLGVLFGSDLCGELAAVLLGTPRRAPTTGPGFETIALFPKELQRDPLSAYLRSPDVLHDVPWDDRSLVGNYVRRLNSSGRRYSPMAREALRESLAAVEITATPRVKTE